jgi:hypothetical protein
MNRLKRAAVCVVLLVILGALGAYGQTDVPAKRVEILYGPRVGVSYIVADPDQFNESIQRLFPDSERKYFPIITQFGLSVEQRIRLGSTASHFAFQEVLIIGGLDQNLVIPSLSVLIGFRSRAGLELGLGPNVSMKRSADESTGVGLSVVYAVGWTFDLQGVYVPVNVAVVPTPSDGAARVTLLTGFNFRVK